MNAYPDTPEPPPIDYENDWGPPPPDDTYFMPDDPFPDDLFTGMPVDDGYVPEDDPWLPEDDRFVPADTQHLPDMPPLAQDGLQGFEVPEPADEGWSWHDARLIGVERETETGTRYEVGAIDVYANMNTGDLGGSYLPVAAFDDVDVASAFYHSLQEQIHDGGLPAYQVPGFAERQAAAMNPDAGGWRGAEPEEYAVYDHLRGLDAGDLAGRDEPPDCMTDPLLQTAIELGGVVVERTVETPPIEDDSAFQALSAIGVQADGFNPAQDPPPFYDAATGTAYWIGVFQPDKDDRANCITSILSLGRNPETGAMEAQLAPCVPGDWDKAYTAAEYLIQVAQKGGIEPVFDAAEGMALATDPHENLSVCFDLSVEQLPAEDRALYYALGAFPEDVPIPQAVATKLWRGLMPELTQFDSDELAVDLGRLALLERDPVNKTLVLHDLLYEYAREKLEPEYVQTQNALLVAYNPDDKPWYEIPHDGYLYYHLAYHLKEAGRTDELHTLLTGSPDWMRAKAKACVGDGAFISDLVLLLADYTDPLPDAAALVRLAELHTARQVVNVRVTRYTDKDLEILVWLDRTEEALGYARPRVDAKDRFDGLLAIYKALVTRKLPVGELVDEMETTIRVIPYYDKRASALRELAVALAQAGQYDRAETVAESISSNFDRVYALCDLAGTLAQAEDGQRAMMLFAHVETLVRTVLYEVARTYALITLAVTLAQVGEREQATLIFIDAEAEVVNISDTSRRADALSALAAALAQAGEFSHADTVARSIADDSRRTDALSALAAALAQVGEYDRAERVAAGIMDDSRRTDALSALAVALVQAGKRERAVEVFTQVETIAKSIANDSRRTYALRILTVALAQAGELKHAETIAKGIVSDSSRVYALRSLATALAQAGDAEQAAAIFNQAEKIAKSIVSDFGRVGALSALARVLTQAGEGDTAAAIFTRAEMVVRSMVSDSRRTDALSTLAEALAQAGEYNYAKKIVESIVSDSKRTDALRDLAAMLAQNGEYDRAEVIAGSITSDYKQADAFSALAAALAQAGEYDHAEVVVESIVPDSKRTDALCNLAATLAQSGEYDRAQAMVGSITSDYKRVDALSTLAAALVQDGDKEQAAVIFTHAEMVAKTIASDSRRADALIVLAAALARAGDRERAAVIFAQAKMVAKTIVSDSRRADALIALAAALVQAREYNEARVVARSIASNYRRADALQSLATSLTERGEYDYAEIVARDIVNDYRQTSALCNLAAALAHGGKYHRAEAIVSSITSDYSRTSALRNLATALAKGGQHQRAFSVLGVREIEEYIQFLVGCREGVVKLFDEGGHSAWRDMLVTALRIIAWERPDWGEIADVLASN